MVRFLRLSLFFTSLEYACSVFIFYINIFGHSFPTLIPVRICRIHNKFLCTHEGSPKDHPGAPWIRQQLPAPRVSLTGLCTKGDCCWKRKNNRKASKSFPQNVFVSPLVCHFPGLQKIKNPIVYYGIIFVCLRFLFGNSQMGLTLRTPFKPIHSNSSQ